MLFALGFLSMMLGLAMLVLGEMPISKSRRVPAKASRIAGAVLVAYFPLVLAIRYLWVTLGLEKHVPGNIVFAVLWVVLAMAAAWIALRAAFPKKERAALPKLTGAPPSDPFDMVAPMVDSGETMVPETLTVEEPVTAVRAPAAKSPKSTAPAKKAPASGPKSPTKSNNDNPFDFS
jgi:hypothetical protein